MGKITFNPKFEHVKIVVTRKAFFSESVPRSSCSQKEATFLLMEHDGNEEGYTSGYATWWVLAVKVRVG